MSNALAKLEPGMKINDEDGCRNLMALFNKQITNTLPSHIPPGVMMNAVLNSVRKNELAFQKGKTKHRLTDCSAASMLSAIMCCAETGLVPDSPAQECHLIPFGGQVTWMPGYRGLAKLARQGDISKVRTVVVWEGDDFSYELGLHPDIHHVQCSPDKRGALLYVYAVMEYKKHLEIEPDFEVMTKAEVDKVRAAAPGGRGDAWTNWYEEQARKTVLKRLLKVAPSSNQLVMAVDQDNKLETGEAQELHAEVQELVGAAINARKPATQRLTDDLKKQNGATEEATDESKEALIREVLLLALDNELVVRAKVLDKCTEENLREMAVEAIGVLRQEILDDIKKAEEKAT